MIYHRSKQQAQQNLRTRSKVTVQNFLKILSTFILPKYKMNGDLRQQTCIMRKHRRVFLLLIFPSSYFERISLVAEKQPRKQFTENFGGRKHLVEKVYCNLVEKVTASFWSNLSLLKHLPQFVLCDYSLSSRKIASKVSSLLKTLGDKIILLKKLIAIQQGKTHISV